MSFKVKILRRVWENLKNPQKIEDIFILYGFYANTEKCTYIIDAIETQHANDFPRNVDKTKENLEMAGWGYLSDPDATFISFKNFKIQTRIQDIKPTTVMAVVNSDPEKNIRFMHLNKLRLEKVPFTIIDELNNNYDDYISQQKTLARFTDYDTSLPEEHHIITKKEIVLDALTDLRENVSFLQDHNISASNYPDFEKAEELATNGLFGRALFYLKRAQKNIENDVVIYRYKEKYDALLNTIKSRMGKKSIGNDATGDYDIEMLIERASQYYNMKSYKEAFFELSSIYEKTPLDKEEEADYIDEDLEPILNIEEFESEMFSSKPYEGAKDTLSQLENTDNIKEKIELLKKSINEDPHNTWAWGELGDCYFDAGDLEKSLGSYIQQLKKTPKNSILLNNIGMIYKLKCIYKNAIEYFVKAIQVDPEYADPYYNLGFIMFEEGDLEEAINNYKKALDINPEFRLARDSLNVVLKKRDSYAKQQFLWKREKL